MDIPEIATDIASMRLAHPSRCAAAETQTLNIFKKAFGPRVWADLETAFRRQDELTGTLFGDLCAKPGNEVLLYMANATSRMPGGTEVGNAYASLIYLRHAVSPQPYFVIEDSLVELLEHTDIADDVTMGTLNLPYSRFFVEFGKERRCTLRLPNISSGLHVLEGCYVERGKHPEHGECIFILLTGSPLGKENAMDDATHSLVLPIGNPDQPIRNAIDWMHREGTMLALNSGLRTTPREFVEMTFECVLFLAKVLLYIGLPEARKELHKDKTEWLKSVSGLKSSAKKAKAEKRGRGLVDHILVHAPPPLVERANNAENTGRSVKSHWRRGHYRMQPYGPQSSLRKVKFIQAMLVMGNQAESDAPAQRYQVR